MYRTLITTWFLLPLFSLVQNYTFKFNHNKVSSCSELSFQVSFQDLWNQIFNHSSFKSHTVRNCLTTRWQCWPNNARNQYKHPFSWYFVTYLNLFFQGQDIRKKMRDCNAVPRRPRIDMCGFTKLSVKRGVGSCSRKKRCGMEQQGPKQPTRPTSSGHGLPGRKLGETGQPEDSWPQHCPRGDCWPCIAHC